MISKGVDDLAAAAVDASGKEEEEVEEEEEEVEEEEEEVGEDCGLWESGRDGRAGPNEAPLPCS